jgi:hypothetical protein
MMTLIKVLAVTAAAASFVALFALMIGDIEWSATKFRTVGKISFNHFKGLYRTNPKRWVLYNGHVAYREESAPYGEYDFHFGFWDYMRYRNWKDNVDEQKKKEENNKALRACIESWNRDLEEYRLKIENKEMCEKCRLNGICNRACPDVLNGGNK